MDKLLGKFPLDYLQYLYMKKLVTERFMINGKDVFENESLELYEGEKFKKHPSINIYVSNYGRVKSKDGKIEKQKEEKHGYLYIDIPFKDKEFDKDIHNNKKHKYRTNVVCAAIDKNDEIETIKREKFDAHPYLQIYKNKRGYFFSKEYGTNNRYYYKTINSKNGEQLFLVPVYIYRLVAETWIPNPDTNKYRQVHHIINNGYNNTIFNLMWVTIDQHRSIERRSVKK